LPTTPSIIPQRKFKTLQFILVTLLHLVALLAVFPYFFSWPGLILCAVMIWVTGSLGVSLAYHRLLSHKAWQVHPALRKVLLFCAALSLQSGPIAWSATHRMHHRESDHVDDAHSPLVSFVWGHLLWIFHEIPRAESPEDLRRVVPDLLNDPLLQWFERNIINIWIGFGLAAFASGYFIAGGGAAGLQLGLSLLIWGHILRTVWGWHSTGFVNSVTHLFGYRNFNTEDESRNLWWVSILTFGEGWHNNHHAIAGSARFTQRWWEFDPGWWMIKLFRALGLVKSVTVAPKYDASAAGRFAGKIGAQSPRLPRRPERQAMRLLARFGHSPSALIDMLRSRKTSMREAAALALGNLGERAHEAADALAEALADRSERVHEAAVQALVRIGNSAVPALQQTLQNAQELRIRLGIARVLQCIQAVD